MTQPPSPTPSDPSPGRGVTQPLLAGLDARQLVMDMLGQSLPLSLSANWEAPTPDELSRLLVGYEVSRMLGRGGMGAVYLARESRLGRNVAIKLLPPELGQRSDFRQRFEREARILAQLDHPHIVRLFGLGESEGGHLYLVMEFVEGSSMAELLQEARLASRPGEPVVAWPRLVSMVGQLCEALEYAHSLGLVHRDLKPANVLLTGEGDVKLADFGLARPMLAGAVDFDSRALVTQTGQLMGTYDYMAPEQRDGLPGDHRVDLYGVGVLLYQMLTGALPRGVFPLPSAVAGVSPAVDRVVLRALASTPDDRTPDAKSVHTALLGCPPDGRRRRWAPPPKKTAAALRAGVGLVVLGRPLVQRPGRTGDAGAVVAPLVSTDPAPAPLPVSGPPRRQRQSFLGHVLLSLTPAPSVMVAEAETTVGQYRQFVRETNRPSSPAQWEDRLGDPLSEVLAWDSPGHDVTDEEPVVCVSWQDADDFCRWMTRKARASGELLAGQEYRLPTDMEWRWAFDAVSPSSHGAPGARLLEWNNEHGLFNRPWHGNHGSSGRANAQADPPKVFVQTSMVQDTGHTGLGFRIALDLKNPRLLPHSARLWAAAEAWSRARPDLPAVSVLVTSDIVRADLTRRPDIRSLDPLRGMGLTDFWAAPTEPLDLAPLTGQPIHTAYLGGPVVSLQPLEASPLARLSLGGFDLIPPLVRGTPPSLRPLLSQRRLRQLSWRCQDGGPDVPLDSFPELVDFSAWDCRLPGLEFFQGAILTEASIDRSEVDLAAGVRHLATLSRLEATEQLMTDAHRLVLDGDLDGALLNLENLMSALGRERWFDGTWKAMVVQKLRQWSEWKAGALGPWLRAGANGPPPGSVEWRGRWFYLLRNEMTRDEAEYCAADWGGFLATLADNEEEEFVRVSVMPLQPSQMRAHLGAWRPAARASWRWITGEPWTAGTTRENNSGVAGSFLVFKAGPERWFAERNRRRSLPTLIEWANPTENSARTTLLNRLIGKWRQDDGRQFELGHRGRVGPDFHPGDRWMVVDSASGQAVLSRNYGKTRLLLTTGGEANQLVVSRPDGTTLTATRLP